MDNYSEFQEHAKLYTNVHAKPKKSFADASPARPKAVKQHKNENDLFNLKKSESEDQPPSTPAQSDIGMNYKKPDLMMSFSMKNDEVLQ